MKKFLILAIAALALTSCQKDYYLDDLNAAQDRVAQLNTKVSQLTSDNSNLNTRINSLQSDLTNIQSQLNSAVELNDELNDEINALENEVDELSSVLNATLFSTIWKYSQDGDYPYSISLKLEPNGDYVGSTEFLVDGVITCNIYKGNFIDNVKEVDWRWFVEPYSEEGFVVEYEDGDIWRVEIVNGVYISTFQEEDEHKVYVEYRHQSDSHMCDEDTWDGDPNSKNSIVNHFLR